MYPLLFITFYFDIIGYSLCSSLFAFRGTLIYQGACVYSCRKYHFVRLPLFRFSEWMLFKKKKRGEEGDTEHNIQYRLSGIMVASYSKMFPIIERFSHCCLLQSRYFFCVAAAIGFVCNLIRSLCSLKSQTHKRNPNVSGGNIRDRQKKGPISNKNTFQISHIYCRL